MSIQLADLDSSQNLLVHACAGSGKTWLLTSRIVRILLEDQDISPSHILAITYTRAAAEEINTRVLERVDEMARAGSTEELSGKLREIGLEPSSALLARARQLHRLCLFSRPGMTISTFHGWFRILTQSLPWGMKPTQVIQIIEQNSELLDRAWRVTVGLAVNDSTLGAALAELLGQMGSNQIKDMLETMIERRLAWEMSFDSTYEGPAAAASCISAMEALISAGWDEKDLFDNRELLWKMIDELLIKAGGSTKTAVTFNRLCQSAQQARNPEQFMKDLGNIFLTKEGRPRNNLSKLFGKMGGGLAFAFLVEKLETVRMVVTARAAAAFNKAAAVVGTNYARAYEKEKAAVGVVDFGDLELLVWRAMSKHGTQVFVERLGHNYRHILIDEFQDTSPQQWQIMRRWLLDAHGSDRAPGVFIVGDPKQSIYSFRGGDPRLMSQAGEFLAAHYHGIVRYSNTTRRCAGVITRLVNKVFESPQIELGGGFINQDTMQEDLPATVLVAPIISSDREQTDPDSGLRNPLVQAPPRSKVEKLRLHEGGQIAAIIRSAVEQWQITGPTGIRRRCSYEDIMVLYPTRAASEAAARMLRRNGIPCSLPNSGNRLQDLECLDMVALMRAISEPRNALALAHVLCSPIFNADEHDLWLVHKAGGGKMGSPSDWLVGLASSVGGSEGLRQAREFLPRWRESYARQPLPAHELLAKVFHEADIYARYVRVLPREMGERCVRNLEWVLNYAIELDGGRIVQLSEMARRLDGLRGERVGGAGGTAQDRQVVAMMTVHAAKGLESPVVILSNSEAGARPEVAHALTGWRQGEERPHHCSYARSKKTSNSVQKECWQQEDAARAREKLNLLYVGMTRASQALVVTATPSRRSSSYGWHRLIENAMIELGADPDDNGMLRLGDDLSRGLAPARPEGQDDPEIPPRTQVLAPTGEVKPAPTAAARRGTMLHKLLALLLMGVTGSGPQREILGVTSSELAALQADARSILGGSELVALRKAATAINVEVSVVDEDGLQQRIDCLIDVAGEKWIIDFKSSSKPAAAAHREQLTRYRQALINAGESAPIRMALIGRDGSLREIEG